MSDGTSLNTITKDGVTTSASSSTQKATSTVAGGSLGKDAFLQLLVKQMQYQDPLDPQDNATYIAQLANFSTLEQTTNMATQMTNISSAVGNINDSTLVGQLSSMIGKNIQWMDKDSVMHTGNVRGVSVTDNSPSLVTQETGGTTLVSVPAGELTLIGGNAS
ncbi:MAG: flagellar hook capping FlgD N-terminal domain-containing protein [Selenomonadaceae bacterium]